MPFSESLSAPSPPSANVGGDVRRLALLYDLMTRLQAAAKVADVYAAGAETLAEDASDIPFAVFYSLSEDGQRALLTGVSGVPRGHALAPELISPETPHVWPVADVVRTGEMQVVGPLGDYFSDLAAEPWPQPPVEALLLPLSPAHASAARGVLVLGVDSRHLRDAAFEQFAHDIARRVGQTLLSVEVLEAERERAKSVDMLAQEVEHRRRIERQQNLLLDELNHRVKNTLATVQAIAIQTLKGADAPARDAFIARLFALSSQHDLLTLGNWEGAALEGVVRRALRPYREDEREEERERFTVRGPPVHLSPKRALALGLAFHELATNAARHGALSSKTGRVQVSWTVAEDAGALHLVWRESGGPRITAPGPRGFGLRLIEQGLAREISGSVNLQLAPDGLLCSWDMKLP
jgi:two-component sensor histidine kinase